MATVVLKNISKIYGNNVYAVKNVHLEVADKESAMREIERRFSSGRIDRLDGVSIEFDDFWFNVRPSNTEPLLRLRLEARTAEVARARSEEIQGIISGAHGNARSTAPDGNARSTAPQLMPPGTVAH